MPFDKYFDKQIKDKKDITVHRLTHCIGRQFHGFVCVCVSVCATVCLKLLDQKVLWMMSQPPVPITYKRRERAVLDG